MIGRTSSALWLAAALACGGSVPGDAGIEVAGPRDGRFALDVTADGGRPAGRLQVNVEPRSGWHLALEAPARLAFSSSQSVRFEPASQTHEHATHVGEDGLAFELAYAEAAEGEIPVEGRIKFGMCRDDSQHCEIVRRDLAFELPAR